MRKSNFQTYLWFRGPFLAEAKFQNLFEIALGEFCDFWHNREIDIMGGIRRVVIAKTDPPKYLLDKVKAQRSFSPRVPSICVHLSTPKLETDETFFIGLKDTNGKLLDWGIEYLPEFANWHIQKVIEESLLASSLATPGALNVLDGCFTYRRSHYSYYEGWRNGFEWNLNRISIRNKRILKNFDLVPTFNWLSKTNVWSGSRSATKIEKAICAFAYLGRSDSEVEALFWAMFGIEALFSDGTSGVREKLRRRVPGFISGVSAKDISRIYDYRSTMFHGGANLRLPEYEDLDFEDRQTIKQEKLVDLARTILISSLQKLAAQNAVDLVYHDTQEIIE
ncbi:MAG: hypothetical protein GKS00_28825 [Alphaproteobacteria bacterium]|nr:hypothetical protein [Alphaproteobacteria bacterium]